VPHQATSPEAVGQVVRPWVDDRMELCEDQHLLMVAREFFAGLDEGPDLFRRRCAPPRCTRGNG